MLNGLIDFSWTLFLDRDGVINKRLFGDYIKKKEDFVFEYGAIDFLKFAKKHFHKIIIITNQQGVGKGEMSDDDLHDIHDFMLDTILKEGGRIDRIYVATNLKNAVNDKRKPLPEMGYLAKNDFPSIDFNKSIMIGDTNSDIIFGKNLQMKTVLVKSEEQVSSIPDYQINNLTELIF
jgi:histidinol-phosphate phosphatase family protein